MPDPQPLRNPDVQVEAVLADVGVGVPHLLALEPGEILVPLLVARVGQGCGVVHAMPRFHRHGSAEPERADGRLGERYAGEHVYFSSENSLAQPSHQTASGLYDERVSVLGAPPAGGAGRPGRLRELGVRVMRTVVRLVRVRVAVLVLVEEAVVVVVAVEGSRSGRPRLSGYGD